MVEVERDVDCSDREECHGHKYPRPIYMAFTTPELVNELPDAYRERHCMDAIGDTLHEEGHELRLSNRESGHCTEVEGCLKLHHADAGE